MAEPDPYVSDPQLDPSTREAPISEERLALEQCQSHVVHAAADGTLDAAQDTCCRTMADHYFNGRDPESADPTEIDRSEKDRELWMQVAGPCCDLIGFEVAACTPWGPPMPPGAVASRSGPARPLDLRRRARASQPRGLARARIEPRVRAMAIATWRARMVNEHGSAPVFEGLVEQLEGLVAAGMLDRRELEHARCFPEEERHHGVLCGAVVEALGGSAEATALPEREFPRHADAGSPLEAGLRNLLSICCLSETVAVALIAAERADMPEGPLRELLTKIWADECGHARFGWRILADLLARVDAATIERLGTYLCVAFGELERHELAHLPIVDALPAEAPVYGLCDGAEARTLFRATVERVIIPGLEARGLPARTAWATRASA
ncbi:MAG TPA: hypothetical protein VM869_34760 [Enhygromyxa sp.]|nr:hypothetical protein [Enhygromyxa sp.]